MKTQAEVARATLPFAIFVARANYEEMRDRMIRKSKAGDAITREEWTEALELLRKWKALRARR